MGKPTTPRERISKARIKLLDRFPFFGSIAMKMVIHEMTPEEVEQTGCTTAGVDIYGNLFYNPAWIDEIDDEFVLFTMAHEVLHLCMKHPERLGGRQHEIWNLAVDATVNNTLSETWRIPDGLVDMPNMKGKCGEEIYDFLIKDLTPKTQNKYGKSIDFHIWDAKGGRNNSGQGNTSKQGNIGTEGNSPFKIDGQLPFDEVRAIKDAYDLAKGQGKLPAGMERIFGDILAPKLNWKDQLRKYLVNILPCDYTYTRPSKKSYSTGFYMPTVTRESIELAIGIDTSGSVSNEEYMEFLSEIMGICSQFDSVKATIIPCDADVTDVYEVNEHFDPTIIKSRGYGGTLSEPVYKWLENNIGQENVKLLIYFTDGFIDPPKEAPSYHTLWVITKNGSTEAVERMDNATVIQMPKD